MKALAAQGRDPLHRHSLRAVEVSAQAGIPRKMFEALYVRISLLRSVSGRGFYPVADGPARVLEAPDADGPARVLVGVVT